MAITSKRRNSDTEFLHDLEALNQYLSPPNFPRRKPSLTLPTSPASTVPVDPHRLPLHLSSSQCQQPTVKDQIFTTAQTTIPIEKTRGFFNWKPIRMLTHIGKRRISCFFSVEVIAVRNLPESLNGLRLSVGIRKGDSKEGSVRALPSRVLQGSAEFEETLFVHCNVYCSGGAATGKPVKLEPRPFLIYIIAVDSPELELGSSFIDLSQLIRESAAGSLEGFRIRVWDAALELAGKAEGGSLVLRLGFQLLDDGGVGIYNRVIDQNRGFLNSATARGRRQSKNSFSISTLDSRVRKMPIFEQPEEEDEYFQVPKFRTVNNGGEASNEAKKESIPYTEVVKGVIHNRVEKQLRLVELNSLANELKDLESTMSKTMITTTNLTEKSRTEQLDDSEQSLTKEFLQMLDNEANNKELKAGKLMEEEDHGNQEPKVLLSDLGNGLGPVIQTKDGGFLASMNPFKVEMFRKETPKLAAQISKPLIIQNQKLASGLEIFQSLASVGFEKLCCKFSMDELQGKTAEQIAFEGIASVIISGRNREGASSSASKSLAAVKRLTAAISHGRKERSSKEIQSAEDESNLSIENIIAFTMQGMEKIALEALKIHADMAEEDASFDVPRNEVAGADNHCEMLDSIISIDDWLQSCEEDDGLTVLAAIQLRDPGREFEAVGAPIITLTQVIRANDDGEDDEERRYKVMGFHAGGMKGARLGEKSKLSASQWLLANGVRKMGKKSNKTLKSKLQEDVIWSLSSRIMEGVMLRTVRNPDVKISK